MDPDNTAVLAIHWQRDIVRREGAFGEFYGQTVERTGVVGRTAGVLASARELGVPIFYTRVCFGEGHPELLANSPLLKLVGQRNALVDGSPGADIVPDLSPQPGDVVVNHTRVAGTHGTSLIEQLRARSIESVAILGVSTNISVEEL
jgi:biuret amidohydrolase